jgi:Polysaccharide lyase
MLISLFDKVLVRTKLLRSLLMLLMLGAWPVSSAAQSTKPEIRDTFATGSLNQIVWCPCQINNDESPLLFPEDGTGKHFLRVVADEASLGGNNCLTTPPVDECPRHTVAEMSNLESVPDETPELDFSESLGQSLIGKLRKDAAKAILMKDSSFKNLSLDPYTKQIFVTPDSVEGQETGPDRLPSPRHTTCKQEANSKHYCDRDAHERADASGEENTCIQRQELRLAKGVKSPTAADDSAWYSIRFRMPQSIEDTCNSVRWVTAQWKHKSGALKNKTIHQSPMLAQRFDDGILHVTIQDGPCRCIVASAKDPQSSNQVKWTNGQVPKSLCSSPTQPKGCPANLFAQYSDNPALKSPLGEWTTMTYFLKPGWKQDGSVEVYQDGRHIVTVTGNIGYEIGDEKRNKVKFKFGHYRDYMPFHHEMDVELVTISANPPSGIEVKE